MSGTRAVRALAAGGLLAACSVTSTLAATSNPSADASIYRGVRGWSWGAALTVLVPWVPAAAAVCIVLALVLGRRCRAVQALALAAPAAATAIGWLVALVVGRDRPYDAPPGAGSTHPATGVLLLAAAAATVVVAARVAGWSRGARAVLSAVLGLSVLLVSVAEVRAGDRWPLDVLASWLLAGVVVLVALLQVERPAWHVRCRGCPWVGQPLTEPSSPVVRPTPRRARSLETVALVWLVVLVAGYVVLALTVGMPRVPGSGLLGRGLEVPVQWCVLAVGVLGVVLVQRGRHAVGAVLGSVAAAVLGVASSVEYPPVVAVLVTVVTAAPGLLLWLARSRGSSGGSGVMPVAVLSVVGAVLLGVVTGGASATYSAFWGPTHPGSATPAPQMRLVEWMWAGATTSTSTQVRMRLDEVARDVRVVVSEVEDLSVPVASVPARVDGDGVATATVEGLEPATRYHYAAEVDGVLDRDRVQSVRTFPEGAASFGFVFGSCQNGGSNGRVFDAMRATDPLFALVTGDWSYSNIEVDDVRLFQDQYDANLGAPAQAALYGQTSMAYVWDDHDYGGNDADRTSPSRPAAVAAYRQAVPHYPLSATADAAIFQAFTVGRVRFLLTDTRSARDPAGDPSGPYRSALGAEQREWLLAELADADRYGLVVWVSPDPWVDAEDPAADTWGGFAEERQVLADAIADARVDNLLMLSGDAHMLAVDDGTNTDYSSSGRGGFPLFHAAALDRRGSTKGGPYSGPVLPGSGQFGAVEVVDDGSTLTVTLIGMRWDGEELLRHVLTFEDG